MFDPRFKRTYRLSLLLVAVALPLQLATPLAADTVVLRTGEVFSGKVLRANQEEVSIQLESGGILSFRANRVGRVRQQGRSVDGSDTIVYNAAPEPSLEPAPLPAAPASGPGAPPLILRPGAPATPKEPGTTPMPKDLSSFPLHAHKNSAAAIPSSPVSAPVSGNAVPSRFRDTANGYSLLLPRGLKVWDERQPANVL